MIRNFQTYFDLTSAQINDLYNYVTEDGKKHISFGDFKDLIYFLEENKQSQDKKTLEITVTPDQYAFIEDNLEELPTIRTKELFVEWLRVKTETDGLIKEPWSEELISGFYNMMDDFFEGDDIPEPRILLTYLNVMEPTHSDAGRQRKSSLNVENQNLRSIESIKMQLSSFIEELNGVKSREPSENVYQIFKSSLLLSDNITVEVD